MATVYRHPGPYRAAKTYRGLELVPAVQVPSRLLGGGFRWELPTGRQRMTRLPVRSVQAQGVGVALPAGDAEPAGTQAAAPWGTPDVVNQLLRLPFGQASQQIQQAAELPFGQSTPVNDARGLPWGTAAPAADTLAAGWGVPAQINSALATPWGTAEQRNRAVAAFWRQAAARGAVVALPWGPAGQRQVGVGTPWPIDPNPGNPGGTLQPIIREAYIMVPVISAVVLPGRAPLNVLSVSLSTDVESYGWRGSAQIPFREVGAIKPNPEPVEIEISINGYTWVLLVDDYTDNRRFNSNTASLQLLPRSAKLDAPYAPARTGLPDEARTANQLGDEQLFGTGWSLVWDAVDWLVPGERWSYQDATAMQALGELAAAIGAGIETARTTLELQVRPRYPTSPWDWGTASPYAVIPAHIIASLSGGAARGPGANGVYVFDGVGSGALVRIDGTGGEVQATQIVERLLANEDALQERGRAEIARAGRVSTPTLQIPLFPSPAAPGLLPLRALLQVTEPLDPADPEAEPDVWRAQVMGVRIDASKSGEANSVRQTLTLERHHHD